MYNTDAIIKYRLIKLMQEVMSDFEVFESAQASVDPDRTVELVNCPVAS